MKYKSLGRSGLIVSELCLGTMVFGEDTTRAAEVQLSSDELGRLDEVSALEEGYQYRFLNMYAAR